MKHQTSVSPIPNLPAVAALFGPSQPVPDTAPAIKVDIYNPDLSIEDVLPENYMSLESLTAWLELREAEARVLTVANVTMELLYDPAKETPAAGEWKPVLWFHETEFGLVVNKSRGQMLVKMANSPRLADWAKVGQVALRPGIANGKAQIIIAPLKANGKATGKRTVDPDVAGQSNEAINADLFG